MVRVAVSNGNPIPLTLTPPSPSPQGEYLFTVVGTARGQRAALSAPRSAAHQHVQASAAREVFRPLHAGGDAAARRYVFTVGSTGDSPVPSGDPPDGTKGGIERNNGVFSRPGFTNTPPGGSPRGAGGSPAPPSVNRYARRPYLQIMFGR